MNQPPSRLSHEEVLKQRAEIRRGLLRVNTALLAIVTVVVGLALAGILAAYHARERAAEARAATARAQQELWKSYLAQATANRLSATMGRKGTGEAVVGAAARIRPSLELRSEAIAQMALTDLQDAHQEDLPPSNGMFTLAPSLNYYAVASKEGLVEVRSLAGHQQLCTWSDTNRSVAALYFAPRERYLVVVCRSSGFQVVDLQDGAPVVCIPALRAFDFSGDGQILAGCTDDHTVRFFELASGHETRPSLTVSEPVKDLTFEPTGDRLAVNAGRTLEIWDASTGRKMSEFEHDAGITAMAWSEHYLAAADGAGGMEVWDLRSRRSRRWNAHKSLVDTLFFNHKGDLLVSDSWDGSCKLWNPNTGNLVLETTKGFGTGFSPDDTLLAYATRSSRRSVWGWWQMDVPRAFRTLDCSDGSQENVWQVDFSPDGRLLAIMRDDGLRLVTMPAFIQQVSIPMRRGRAAYFLPEGKTLVTCGDGGLALWPVQPGSALSNSVSLGPPTRIPLPKAGHVDTPTMDWARRQVVLPLTDTDAALVDLASPGQSVLFSNGDCPKSPALSPDGKWVVTGTFHGRGAMVWDAATGKKFIDLDEGNCNAVFSPDGKTLVLAGDKEYRFYATGTWKLVKRIPTESMIDLPNCAAFSRDGRLLAIVKERHLLQLIDPNSGVLLASFAAPDLRMITQVCFNWDSTVLAAVAGEAVQLWDLPAVHLDLGRLGLDWDGAAGSAAAIGGAGVATQASAFALGSGQSITIAVGAVGLVIFCAVFVLRRQRQLFSSYVQIDALVEQRNRELEVAQTELMHSQKMKALGTLAAGIAHDFNNLLSVIRMSNRLIGRQAEGKDEIKENVAEIEKAVQQGKHVVGSMLGYGNQKAAANGSFVLPDLVEDSVGLLSRQFLSGITLDLELDRESPAVTVPRARVEQILLNLIVNAAEAMEGRGHLRIQVRTQAVPMACEIRPPRSASKYVELHVADTGCGIEPELLSRIFDPFFTTKVRGPARGSGLGLSMVYTLAEQDGLGIGVSSTLGRGTTFRIVIPVDASTPEPVG